MSAKEIDDYLANLEEPKRTTLSKLRSTIVGILPHAEQGIAYGCPAFRMHGKVVPGFAAFKNHRGGRPLSHLERRAAVSHRQPPPEGARAKTHQRATRGTARAGCVLTTGNGVGSMAGDRESQNAAPEFSE